MKIKYLKIRFRRAFLRLPSIPALVWLGAVGLVIVMFMNRSQRFEAVGIVQNHSYQVAPEVTGKITNVNVDLFEPVQQGQLIAELSAEHIDAELAVIKAEVEKLRAELMPTAHNVLAESADRKIDWIAANRRFATDIEATRVNIMELKTEIEVDKITLQDLELEVKIAEDLLERDAISEYELQKAQADYEALETKIQENKRNLAQAEKDLKQTMERRDTFTEQLPHIKPVDSLLEPIYKDIAVQKKRAEKLTVEKKRFKLFSPGDGVVNKVFTIAGETVRSGEPIVNITSSNPSQIIVYAKQGQFAHIAEGDKVKLAAKNNPQKTVKSRVVKTGPAVVKLPEQLWSEAGIPEWGKPIIIKLPAQLEVVPGELVMVRKL